ncbi:MAG: hypothetical protein JWP97_2246 [Labilithrix sp.]|nr:hypothetical protein [Labilithrix sp.]
MRAAAGALAALVSASLACGPAPPAAPPAAPETPLHLAPACDLVPAAGLAFVVDARPRAIAETPDLIPVIALVVPEARFDAFARSHGGVDVRQVTDLCVARYRESWLTVARTAFDPATVEKAFADRMTHPGSRRIEVANPPVVRTWGEVNGEPQQLVVFGREAIALEQGRAGPVRAAEAFAVGKLRRASPALRSATLLRVSELLEDAPARLFAPGPFEGDLAAGLGGLLRATTALGVAVRFAGPPARLAVRLVLTGAWGKDAPVAAERLAAAVHVVSESALGHLLGIDRPLEAPRVRALEDALVVDAVVDGAPLARGLHDAVDAEIGEILGR